MIRLSSILVIAAVAPLAAHHSFASYYFEEQLVSIAGEVVDFEYVAPHAWVHVMAPDEAGQMQRFSAEWSNPTRLARDRITAETLQRGDRVVITGSPGRDASERKLHLKRIERPADAWSWGNLRNRRPRR